MLLFDGIVFSLQETGGISVLLSEIISRLPAGCYELMELRKTPPTAIAGATYSYDRPRPLERYRRARTRGAFDLFHSTYYRLPTTRRSKVVTTVYDFVYERFAPVHRCVVHALQKQKAGAWRTIADINYLDTTSHRCHLSMHGSSNLVASLISQSSYQRLPDEPGGARHQQPHSTSGPERPGCLRQKRTMLLACQAMWRRLR
jgi:hypothetical protein